MFSRSVEEAFERACENAGLNPDRVKGFFTPKTDEDLRKLTELIKLFSNAFRAIYMSGYPIDEVLEDISSLTDFSLSTTEIASAWDEYLRSIPGLSERMVEYGLAEVGRKTLAEFVKPKKTVRRRSFEEYLENLERLVDSVRDYLKSRGKELNYELGRKGLTPEEVSWSSFEERINKELDSIVRLFMSKAISLTEARRRVKEVMTEIDSKVRDVKKELSERALPPPTTVCPKGEEPLKLEVLWGYFRNNPKYKTELQMYILANWSKLFPNRKRPTVGTPEAEREATLFATSFSYKHRKLAEELKNLTSPIDMVKYTVWCPLSDQFFIIRAGYVRGKYVEKLGRAVTDSYVLGAVEKATAVSVTPQTQVSYPITRPSHRPFGMIAQPQYRWVEPRRILNLIGDRCPICGEPSTNLIIRFSLTIDGYMINAFCPKCMTVFWWIPNTGKKGVNPPSNYESWWKSEWVINLDKLTKQGWIIGPYTRKFFK